MTKKAGRSPAFNDLVTVCRFQAAPVHAIRTHLKGCWRCQMWEKGSNSHTPCAKMQRLVHYMVRAWRDIKDDTEQLALDAEMEQNNDGL
jgi:hypothetical protein